MCTENVWLNVVGCRGVVQLEVLVPGSSCVNFYRYDGYTLTGLVSRFKGIGTVLCGEEDGRGRGVVLC